MWGKGVGLVGGSQLKAHDATHVSLLLGKVFQHLKTGMFQSKRNTELRCGGYALPGQVLSQTRILRFTCSFLPLTTVSTNSVVAVPGCTLSSRMWIVVARHKQSRTRDDQ